ncbi:MAG: 3-isopropylmalate dehydratase large subunit [Mariprofundales bacterium]
MTQTLFDKIWNRHLVCSNVDGSSLLYIDRHLIHEVTSPQAFEGLRIAGRKPWRVSAAIATPDHNVPTTNRAGGIHNAVSRTQVEALDANCDEFGILEFPLGDRRQGVLHVVGPEQGLTLPGMTVVCGDSHTSTHGALGAIAMGIGTSEVEHVLATQTLVQSKPKQMRITVDGTLPTGVTAKDMALFIISQIGTAGGTGYAIEFAGSAVTALSMEGRMSLCNMTIEAGARCGMVAVDGVTIDFVAGRPFSPKGDGWQRAVAWWKQLHSDEEALFDAELRFDAADIVPQVSWGTSPEMVVNVTGSLPTLDQARDAVQREGWQRALEYMGLKEGIAVAAIPINRVFIGSCTNGRIEDIRAAAAVARGRKVAATITQALVVPGSGLVKAQAEVEGLDQILLQAGFEWRDPGCSMCLAMNDDTLLPGEHCASTSNRNFEGRQGQGGRTHLVSPAMAAAAAIAGNFVDVREW